ncbi:coiled-coil domain-containing protein 13 isoform X5 [Fukomys damarensis]|uniref:coiled-coil domain-containing protein 13 isoform X5 n=1 Tax=Fukomys damarensis TaxID=885580 RepID=UPI00053F446B|nr:coiled-coil domain-containing protein 13 isoform X5 [Fukomys damarensis]
MCFTSQRFPFCFPGTSSPHRAGCLCHSEVGEVVCFGSQRQQDLTKRRPLRSGYTRTRSQSKPLPDPRRIEMDAEEASQDTVRLQFKAMQELQHRRLQKQMEAKREKSLQLQSHAGGQEGPSGVSDGLGLLLSGEQDLKSVFQQRVLEDEVQQLRDELRETVDENGRLYKLLKERDFEIKHLKKKIEEDRLAFTGTAGPAGDLVASRVVELSKRNRVLAAESEAARARVKQLSSCVQQLELELQTALARLPAKGATDTGAKPPRSRMGDGTLVLASEVGEDVSVQQLLSSPGTWRGRAQQILVLQSKVRELEKQLGQSRSRSAGTASDELSVHPDPRKLSPQERNLQRIHSLKRERQEGWEKLAGERDALQGELEGLKRKFEGARSRNKVLSNEVKTLRGQMGTLAEKGRHDDELIDALMEQLKQLQETLSSLSLQEEKARASQRHQDQEAHSEAQRNSSLVAQLQAVVAEREAKVRQLELEVRQLSGQYLRDKGPGEGSCRPKVNPTHPRLSDDQDVAQSPGSAGDHTSRLGSSRAVSSLGHTLVESVLTRPSLPSPHGTTPSFPDSMEQKGWRAQVTEIKALWQATEVERDRLSEFVTVLQKRVEDSSTRLLEAERELRAVRQRSVVLEQRLEKAQLGPGRTAARGRSCLPASSTRNNLTASEKKAPSSAQLSNVPVESRVEELTARLAVQTEENELLRAALGSALRGKEEDFHVYHETLAQVKGVFLQALRQQRANGH